jgi:hypothetical protein
MKLCYGSWHILRVLFWFLTYTGEVVSTAFGPFWGEIAQFSFMTEILASAALEWAC